DGRALASWDPSGPLQLWQLATGRQCRPFEGHEGPLRGLAISRDGRMLASMGANDHMLRLWEAATSKERWRKEVSMVGMNFLTFSGDGKLLAWWDVNQKVRLWDTVTALPGHALPFENGHIHCLAVSPDGRQVAAGGSAGAIVVWSAATGKK